MRRCLVVVSFTLWGGVLLFSLHSQVYADPTIHYLTDDELTSERLEEILTPPADRGLGLTPGKPPQCGKFRENTRGLAPVSDIAAFRVEFAFDSAELTPSAKKNLSELGQALKANDLPSYCFRIEGYADNIGSDAYNLTLSEKRARSVVRYLSAQYKIDPANLLPVGYGESDPIADNETEDGRQKNRRAQVSNLGTGAKAESKE